MAPTEDMMQVMQDRITEKMNAEAVADGRPLPAFDITTWMELIQSVIQIIQQCRAAKAGGTTDPTATVARDLANPTLIQQAKLRRTMVSHMGRKQFREHGNELHQKLLEVARSASEVDRLHFVKQIVEQG